MILAAHSAGGSQMRKICLQPNPLYGTRIRECWGFDCLYGGVQTWYSWATKNAGAKLFIYYKESTMGNAKQLAAMSRHLPNVIIQKSAASNHYLVPKFYFKQCVINLGQAMQQMKLENMSTH